MADPILIVAALNGSRDRKVAKKLPYTPAEIAKEAKRAVEAGAGVVHVHARRDDGGLAFDLTFDEIVGAIRAQVDVPISITTQRTRADLARHGDRALRRAARAARARDRQRAAARARPSRASRGGAADPRGLRARRRRARAGHQRARGASPTSRRSTRTACWRRRRGCTSSSGGAAGGSEQGLAGTPRNLLRLVDALDGTLGQLRWVAHGEGTATAAVCATAAALGGHIRVGLEDSALLPGRHARRRPTANSSSWPSRSPTPWAASPWSPTRRAACCGAERMGRRAHDRRGRQAGHAPPRPRRRARAAGAGRDRPHPRRHPAEGRRARRRARRRDHRLEADARAAAALPSARAHARRGDAGARRRGRRRSRSCARRPARPASRWRP